MNNINKCKRTFWNILMGSYAYHSIFHIVASVRNDSNYCVGANRVIVHVVVVVHRGSDQRTLRGLQTVQFIVRSVLVRMQREAHGLFTLDRMMSCKLQLIVYLFSDICRHVMTESSYLHIFYFKTPYFFRIQQYFQHYVWSFFSSGFLEMMTSLT